MGKGPVILLTTLLTAGTAAGPAALHGPPGWLEEPWAHFVETADKAASMLVGEPLPSLLPRPADRPMVRRSTARVSLPMPPPAAPRPPAPPEPLDFSFTGIDIHGPSPFALVSGTAFKDAFSGETWDSLEDMDTAAGIPGDDATPAPSEPPLLRVPHPPRKPDSYVLPRSRAEGPPPPPSAPLIPVESRHLAPVGMAPERAARAPSAATPAS